VTIKLATVTATASADAVAALLAGGSIAIRSGVRPATPGTAASGTLLASFTLNSPAFAGAVAGVAALSLSPALTATGMAAGTATWFRMLNSAAAAIMDGDVGTDLTLSSTSIAVGTVLSITSGGYTQGG